MLTKGFNRTTKVSESWLRLSAFPASFKAEFCVVVMSTVLPPVEVAAKEALPVSPPEPPPELLLGAAVEFCPAGDPPAVMVSEPPIEELIETWVPSEL
jgi:hypothetical protein